MDSVPIWTRIHDLPVHCRNAVSVSKLCSSFSHPICMDDPVKYRDKGRFFRVMIEVGISEELPKNMVVDMHGLDCDVTFEYEWKPRVCSLCKKIDHVADQCPKKVIPAKTKKITDKWVIKKKGKLVDNEDAVQVVDEMPQRGLEGTAMPGHSGNTTTLEVSNPFSLLGDDTEAIYIGESWRCKEEEGSKKENFKKTLEESPQVIEEALVKGLVFTTEASTEIVDSGKGGSSGFGIEKLNTKAVVKAWMGENKFSLVALVETRVRQVHERRKLWLNLQDQAAVVDCPWIALGEWNISRFHSEKMRGLRVPQHLLDEFNQVIKDIQMEELPLNNGGWSWNHYGLAVTWHLECVVGPKPFKFLKVWCFQQEIDELVLKAWTEPVDGNPLHKLQKKLRAVKSIIKDWNKKKGKVSEQVQAARGDLHLIQLDLLKDSMNNDLITKEREGYFEVAINFKPKRNFMHPDGAISSDPQVIKDWLMHYYKDLYAAKDTIMTEVASPRIQLAVADLQELDREVSAK
ncbi:uncharacterized protein LOC132305032 [Cornus florida]|uniref:uncharacterized protein LOC132305032 n=1 Tax=Cornus florida TaxID=4283 RepID=UPI0028A19C75|nr:uncharacterized protein LOC132305032 [Cornus florida]